MITMVTGPHYPIFNDGKASYRVCPKDMPDIVLCEFRFQAIEHTTPVYREYMAEQKNMALNIADILNLHPDRVQTAVDHHNLLKSKYYGKPQS